MMDIKIKCFHCGKELGNANFKTFTKCKRGYDKTRKLRQFCNEECYEDYQKQFIVDIHHNKPIYAVEFNRELRYMSYWECSYYFTTIEDCKVRMDATNIGIIP